MKTSCIREQQQEMDYYYYCKAQHCRMYVAHTISNEKQRKNLINGYVHENKADKKQKTTTTP